MKNNTIWEVSQDKTRICNSNHDGFITIAMDKGGEKDFMNGVVCEMLNQNSENIQTCLEMYRSQNS